MNDSDKKFQFSKILPVISIVIFGICLFMGFTADYESMIDVSFYVTSITISGSIVASSFIFYYRKSQQENCVKLKTQMYRVASEERLKFNEKMLLLKSKYQMLDEELENLEEDSPMDEFEQEALNSIDYTIDQAQEEADTMVETPNF